MKKLTVLFVAIVSSLSLFAQTNVTGKFSNIVISSIFEVELRKADHCSAKIECAPELEKYLDVYVSDNTLYLTFKDNSFSQNKLKNNEIKAFVTMSELNSVSLSGASSLDVIDEFRSVDFKCKQSGASSIKNLKIVCKEAEFRQSGASKMTCTVDAKSDFSGEFSGASTSIMNIRTEEMSIEASGSVSAKISAGVSLKTSLEVSGASSITLSGTTKEFDCEASGASLIKASDFKAEHGDVEVTGASSVITSIKNLTKYSRSIASDLKNNGKTMPKQ